MSALGVLGLVALLGLCVTVTAIGFIVVAERRVRDAGRTRTTELRLPQQRAPWPVVAQGQGGGRRPLGR